MRLIQERNFINERVEALRETFNDANEKLREISNCLSSTKN